MSDWITVDQPMIDAFAGATMDHQFIHTDPVRAAAETPLAARLLMAFSQCHSVGHELQLFAKNREQTMGINYGFDKLRFMSPVKTGKRIRGSFSLPKPLPRGRHADEHL